MVKKLIWRFSLYTNESKEAFVFIPSFAVSRNEKEVYLFFARKCFVIYYGRFDK